MAEEKDRQSGEPEEVGEPEGGSGVPEIIRRLASLGLTGFFTTEHALRKALGDTLPREWVDFAAEQSERTRHEVLDRLALEFGKMLKKVDVREMADHLLEGRTIEVTAQIRLGPRATDTEKSEADESSGKSSRVGARLGGD